MYKAYHSHMNSNDQLNHHICANTVPSSTQTIQARCVSKKTPGLSVTCHHFFILANLYIYIIIYHPGPTKKVRNYWDKKHMNRTPSFGSINLKRMFCNTSAKLTSLNLDLFFLSDISQCSSSFFGTAGTLGVSSPSPHEVSLAAATSGLRPHR